MKNVEYKLRISKYLIVFPILVIIWGFGLYFYRRNYLELGWAAAFVNIDFWIVSPLIFIFWWIILFFIIFWAQNWENKIKNLNDKEKQKEIRNKIIKDFRLAENKEKKYMSFYIIVWLLSLTAYVLSASNDSKQAEDLILFLVIWIIVPVIQAVKLWKFVKYKKLKELKYYGECLNGTITGIKEKWKWFLRDDTMRYQIFAESDGAVNMVYKSQNVRFNLPSFLEKWDKINIYIDNGNPNTYFVDIESAFIFWEDE